MNAITHLVSRQTVEVISSDAADAAPLVVRTSAASDMLARVIERGLDAVDLAGMRIRIDRLELDLGPCDPARWVDALADGIQRHLAPKIIEVVNQGGHTREDAASAALHILDEFARSGRMPWWCTGADTPESAIETLELAEHDADAKGALPALRTLLARPAAIDRFVNQLDDRHLLQLLHLARPDLPGEAIAAALVPLAAAQPGYSDIAAASRQERASLWRAVLTEAAFAQPVPTAEPIHPSTLSGEDVAEVGRFLAAVAERSGINAVGDRVRLLPGESDVGTVKPAAVDAPALREIIMPSGELVAALSARLKAFEHQFSPASKLLSHLAALTGKLDTRSIAAVSAALDAGAGLAAIQSVLKIFADAGCISSDDEVRWREAIASALAQPIEDQHDAVEVGTAGLPLLWPFLQTFFGRLEMLDGKRFRDEARQHRAATLLHTIATGEMACPEQELMLAKALAGIDVDAVHDPGEPLEPHELESVESLLSDVLGHAPMLGRISVAGLREAFLKRSGSLSTRDGHWLLRVERRSIDILLDRLPWSFEWVRLPWMAAPMRVEW